MKKLEIKKLYDNPDLYYIKSFIEEHESKFLILLSQGHFKRSEVVSGDKQYISLQRTSNSAIITDNGHLIKYNKIIENIIEKSISIANCKRNQIEGLQIVKYESGDKFEYHHDAYDVVDPICLYPHGGQRKYSIFVWLNTLNKDQKGETEFPNINLKFPPVQGDALFWTNVDDKGKRYEEVFHQGNEVLNCAKYGLNIWIRDTGWKYHEPNKFKI